MKISTVGLTFGLLATAALPARALTTTTTKNTNPISFDSLQNKRVLVVGGSGRVGGSCVTQLVKRGAQVQVGGTSPENLQTSRERWTNLFPEYTTKLNSVGFVSLDRENSQSVQNALLQQKQKFDLVIHTAGPFQGKVKVPNGVLDACVEMAVPYIDVCDDYCTASAAKTKYMDKAKNNGTPCILSTGCWPGVSSLMAKQLVSAIQKQHPDINSKDLKVDFSFFTAGSGGAGLTLLVATFLILSEKALVIQNGRRKEVQAMKDYDRINFGTIVGDKDVSHLNLLETASVAHVLGVGSVQSKFGTAPNFWNALLGLMAQLPPSLLANEDLMKKLSIFSLPIVRLVDAFAGATNAMRCDVTCPTKPEISVTALYAHENLEPCVGECVTAFAAALLSSSPEAVPAGVWFPEEAIQTPEQVTSVLQMASVGAHTKSVETTNCKSSVQLTKEDVW
eukprot:CAMPEP_0198149274 /NCGR_PEP_ID=MMETSP1443-20131203/45822_1 /TAXON_ID=186043 /ORGANISM="Entomoneis sp., Strain CCMP2396" /LENGTH=449 /DNA_ID=CAMNT_0043814257 /DNA_START=59 /DNA_END=1405 /DNA_ORIENTATION=-